MSGSSKLPSTDAWIKGQSYYACDFAHIKVSFFLPAPEYISNIYTSWGSSIESVPREVIWDKNETKQISGCCWCPGNLQRYLTTLPCGGSLLNPLPCDASAGSLHGYELQYSFFTTSTSSQAISTTNAILLTQLSSSLRYYVRRV